MSLADKKPILIAADSSSLAISVFIWYQEWQKDTKPEAVGPQFSQHDFLAELLKSNIRGIAYVRKSLNCE